MIEGATNVRGESTLTTAGVASAEFAEKAYDGDALLKMLQFMAQR